jgi:hypothetical protein
MVVCIHPGVATCTKAGKHNPEEGGALMMLLNESAEHEYLSLDELLDMARRNLAIVHSDATQQEKESARVIARIAAEMFAERIKDF